MIQKSLILLVMLTVGVCSNAQTTASPFGKFNSKKNEQNEKSTKTVYKPQLTKTYNIDYTNKPIALVVSDLIDGDSITTTYDASCHLLTLSGKNIGQGYKHDNYRIVYEYDLKGNLLSSTNQSWDAVNQLWINSGGKMLNTYNSEGKITLSLNQIWDDQNQIYTNNYRDITEYDLNNNKLKYSHENLNGSNWEISYSELYEYIYDNNKNILSNVNKSWWKHLNGYRNSTKNEYTYVNNQYVSNNESDWDTINNAWVVSLAISNIKWHSYDPFKQTFNYDWESGNINDDGNIYRFNTTYIAPNYNITMYDTLDNSSQWHESMKNVSRITDGNNSKADSSFSKIGNNWVLDNVNIYNNDSKGNQILYLNENWKNNSMTSKYATAYEYTYDNTNNMTSKARKDWKQNQFEYYNKEEYSNFFACQVETTGISNLNDSKAISIYPNPSNGSFTISGAKKGDYSITNEVGTIVYEFTVSENENKTFTIDQLSNGIYFLNGENGINFPTKKIVVLN